MASSPIVEGVFAIHKPPTITSAQVIRDVQTHFNPSSLFAPWLAREQARKDAESHNQKNKRRSWKQRQKPQVKIGHGGTLDPLATGVLILGVGNGTKELSRFLECTKSYDTVLLFGAATDTYDTKGKVVAQKDYESVTKEKVEEALAQFKGKIMQRPPIFSALRVQGKRLYEYAREGKEVPVEIEERPVEVKELELVDWFEGGSHEWRWPEKEAETEEKAVVEKVLHLGSREQPEDAADEVDGTASKRRKLDQDLEDETVNGTVTTAKPVSDAPADSVVSGALPDTAILNGGTGEESAPPSKDTPALPRCPAPAVRLRMTVTSGFYVRSLCHDLGAAVGSLGCMASLVRTRQGDFEVGTETVLEYHDLEKGEEIWAPKVQEMLKKWQMESQKADAGEGEGEDGARSNGRVDGGRGRDKVGKERKGRPSDRRERRNTSSEED